MRIAECKRPSCVVSGDKRTEFTQKIGSLGKKIGSRVAFIRGLIGGVSKLEKMEKEIYVKVYICEQYMRVNSFHKPPAWLGPPFDAN